MFVTRYLAPALVVAGTALAQFDCQAPTNTIQNEGDARALSDCDVLTGDLVIAGQTAGMIRIPGVRRIEGSLICREAAELQGIEMPNLSIIDNVFELNGLTIMSSLNFPSLSSVGRIQWTALPALEELSFTSEVTRAQAIRITNTDLKSLDGINLEQVGTFEVTNNRYLTRMDLQLGNITDQLTVQGNSRDLVVSFPNLDWAFNMTFRNCSEVNLPSLQTVNGSMGFFDNYFETFAAPNLTETGPGGSLVFVSNSQLTNISLPQLREIGGTFQIANNTKLATIDGFPDLSQVGGAVDFSGNFTEVSLDALENVRGGFNMQTAAEFDCGPFEQKRGGAIEGRFICRGNTARPGTVAQGDGGAQNESSSEKPSAAAGLVHVEMRTILGLVAGAATWLFMSL